MATTMKEETSSAQSYWLGILDSSDNHPSVMDDTTKAIHAFAAPLLEKATVKDAYGNPHSAYWYAMCLYVMSDDELVNKRHDPAISNYLAQCAFMVALEEGCYHASTWSYGSQLLFEMKKAGIRFSRPLISAFLAQEGDWNSNRSKGDLLEGNIIAVGIYCARLCVLCYSLRGSCVGNTHGEALEKIEITQELATLDDIFGYYLNEFAVPYLESVGSKNAKQQVEAFRTFLRQQSDFYTAPCSTKYHLCRDGGLAEHTNHVLMHLLWLTLPATVESLGACVLAAIGHDLCKVGVYKKQYKSKKIYLAENEPAPEAAFIKTDGGGNFYWADSFYYEFSDSMPFGHGRKSAYILLSFFPEIGADVYSAVDGHMADPNASKDYLKQFGENTLGLNLHIADALATYIDEYNQ